jgi:hypothetical protein
VSEFINELESSPSEESLNIPNTGIDGYIRPILYSTEDDPKEIINLNAGNLRVDENAYVLGNVGIGTTNPTSKLHVVGDTLIEQNLYVSGITTFIGNVDFRGGTNGNIIFGDTSGDNVIFNADVNSNIIPNNSNTYDLGSSIQRWRIGYFDQLDISGNCIIAGISTFGLSNSTSPSSNSQMSFELTNNNTLTIRVRGTDGVLRTGIVTLT